MTQRRCTAIIETMTTNEWDEYASGWDTNDDVRAYARKAYESWARRVRPMVSDLADSRVLDFGCGTGLLSELLAPLCGQIVAVDTSVAMLDVLRRKVDKAGIQNINALRMSMDAVSIAECPEMTSQFDLIVASSVCSFLADYETTLGDLASVIIPGGFFVQWDWMADMPAERVRSAFESSGLAALRVCEEFSMDTDGETMPVIMGIGQLRS